MTIKLVLSPMFLVSMLSGLMPLRLVSLFPPKLAVSPLSIAYTILLSILSICNSVLTFFTIEINTKSSVITTTSRVADIICNCTTAPSKSTEGQYKIIQVLNPQILIFMSLGAHWVSVFRIKPLFPLLLDHLVSIDSKLPLLIKGMVRDGELSKTYYSMAVRFFVILAASFVVYGFYLALHVGKSVSHLLWIVSLIVHNFVSLTCELQLLIFILVIKSRFHIVNGALSSMCNRIKASQKSLKSRRLLNSKNEKTSDLQQVELAHDCYLRLVDAWMLLNNIYAVQVLFSTSGCFLKSLFNIYFLSMCCTESQRTRPTDALNSAVWMMFYFSRFTMLSLETTSTSNESDETKAIIALMGHLYEDPSIKEELDIFWMNASYRKLTFSTCGLFTLNSGLIIKACVTGITYLVLLVQFKPQIGLN